MFNWFLMLSERLYAKQIEEQKTRKNEMQVKIQKAMQEWTLWLQNVNRTHIRFLASSKCFIYVQFTFVTKGDTAQTCD